jgi:hypothetical protein
MSGDEGARVLRADIERWRSVLPEAESTYCQGVASRVAKGFEAFLKRLVASRLAATGCDLTSLLAEVRYGGGVKTVNKLPFGTVVHLVIRLTAHDAELADVCPKGTREVLMQTIDLRNETTHELPPDEMRSATNSLLDFVDEVLRREPLVALL